MLFSDLLFGQIYDTLSTNQTAVGVMLESLEPYILSDRLTSVTPQIMQHFVQHYKARGLLQSVEACITHMEIASLDIHQVSPSSSHKCFLWTFVGNPTTFPLPARNESRYSPFPQPFVSVQLLYLDSSSVQLLFRFPAFYQSRYSSDLPVESLFTHQR